MIKYIDGVPHYYDKNGVEITEGCRIKWVNGGIERVYRTQEGELGTDSTNPHWIATGRAADCEMGIFPLTSRDCASVEVLR